MGFGLFLFLVVVVMEMAPYVFDNSSGAGGAGRGPAEGRAALGCWRGRHASPSLCAVLPGASAWAAQRLRPTGPQASCISLVPRWVAGALGPAPGSPRGPHHREPSPCSGPGCCCLQTAPPFERMEATCFGDSVL